jgi:hypothetical protein
LRLTAAWIAIAWELQDRIKVIQQREPVLPTNKELLEQAVSSYAIADWKEHEEGGLYWIWRTHKQERELVTSTGLAMYLRQLE